MGSPSLRNITEITMGVISQKRTYWDGNEMISYDYKYKVEDNIYENSNRFKMQYDERYQMGDSVKVIYLTSKPKDSLIYSFWEFDFISFWPLFVGLLMIIVGVINWKRKR